GYTAYFALLSLPTRRSLDLALQWEKSRLSHQLARMEKRGLIERTECAEDGRGQIVGVTDAGRRAIQAAAPAHVAAVRRLFLDALDRKSTRLNSSHVKISYAV